MPVVGFLYGGAADASRHYAAAFRKGLSDTGNVEGQNVVVEYHWLGGSTTACHRSWPTCPGSDRQSRFGSFDPERATTGRPYHFRAGAKP